MYYKEKFNIAVSNNEILSEEVTFPIHRIDMIYSTLLDSPWPMQCHDLRHTGRSPYNTLHIDGLEKWRFKCDGGVDGGAVVSDDGIIYFGDKSYPDYIYAVYQNGTLKWKGKADGWVTSTPALSDDGTLYICSWDKFLYAFNSTDGKLKWKYNAGEILAISAPAISDDGSIYLGGANGKIFAVNPNGTEKWRYKTGGDIYSSPAIADDGTIYIGSWDKHLYAMNPNGTLEWRLKTGDIIKGPPSIADDGTVYIGSFDGYLYALYPNNGTVKWRYKTGHWIRTSPCIGDDGTIYVVSLDNHLHAVYPNGTLKWKTDMGEGGTSPTIGQDGTIYAGYKKLHAIYPTNGSVQWTFNPGPGRTIRGATPANSIDGTIYFGTSDGGEIIALNPDGTEKWRMKIGTCEAAPAIGEDGTVLLARQLVTVIFMRLAS